MHIANFAYERSEFRIWCGRHKKMAPKEAVRFRWPRDGREPGGSCAILGPEVNIETNAPNTGNCYEVKR